MLKDIKGERQGTRPEYYVDWPLERRKREVGKVGSQGSVKSIYWCSIAFCDLFAWPVTSVPFKIREKKIKRTIFSRMMLSIPVSFYLSHTVSFSSWSSLGILMAFNRISGTKVELPAVSPSLRDYVHRFSPFERDLLVFKELTLAFFSRVRFLFVTFRVIA